MKYSNVKKISALGTRGSAKGIEFIAKEDRSGKYILNKKSRSPSKGNTTNKAENKISVSTLTEAANLLSTNEYLINLISPDGKRALREYKKVKIG